MKNFLLITLAIFGCAFSVHSQDFEVSKKTEAKLDSFFTNTYNPDEPGCAVLIQQGDEVIYKKAYGMANLELNIAMNPDMIFDLGSIGKQFTAVAIMQLVEQGKIALDDPLDKYIIDYPMQNHTITIEHLLTHTSGLSDIFNIEGFGPSFWRQDYTKDEYLEFLKKAKVEFAPGSKYAYCNTSYILLGYIIEEITGLTRQQYIEENIFREAQMTNSYYSSYHRIIKNRAGGYGKNEETGDFENLERVSPTITAGAGTLMSNTEDFIKYYRALNSYKLITQESLQKTRAKYTLTNGKKSRYGYGLFTGELEGHYYVTHTGGITGYFTSQIYFPNEDIHALIFTNCDTYVSSDPTSKIGEIIFEE